jgi:predicted MPP superfamily phosphohydrolase
LWGEHDFKVNKLEELVNTWNKLQPDLLFDFVDFTRDRSNKIEMVTDFVDKITFLYPVFDALQDNSSTELTSALDLADSMLEPMRCWRELEKELRADSVLRADEEDKSIVHRFGQVLESLDATATVYDSIMKYPHSIHIRGSNGDRAYGSRPRKRRGR